MSLLRVLPCKGKDGDDAIRISMLVPNDPDREDGEHRIID